MPDISGLLGNPILHGIGALVGILALILYIYVEREKLVAAVAETVTTEDAITSVALGLLFGIGADLLLWGFRVNLSEHVALFALLLVYTLVGPTITTAIATRKSSLRVFLCTLMAEAGFVSTFIPWCWILSVLRL